MCDVEHCPLDMGMRALPQLAQESVIQEQCRKVAFPQLAVLSKGCSDHHATSLGLGDGGKLR